MRKTAITGLVLLMALLIFACGSTGKSLSEAAAENTAITKT